MGPSNITPRRLESLDHLGALLGVIVVLFRFAKGFHGLILCSSLDYVGDIEIAWSHDIQDGAEDEVLFPVVVTTYADKDPILDGHKNLRYRQSIGHFNIPS